MKTIKLIVCLLIITSLNAQTKKTGVYLTYDDYLHNKLSYETSDCAGIRVNEFFDAPFITIKEKESSIKIGKNKIYGLATCTKPLIRFYNNEGYYLVEKGAIWIFCKEESVHQGKSVITQKKYLFNSEGNDPLKLLTRDNIKKAFLHNYKLHDLLDVECKKDDDLVVFDNQHHVFKIDEIIKSTL